MLLIVAEIRESLYHNNVSDALTLGLESGYTLSPTQNQIFADKY